ncbi:carboxypeptidase N subunit 2-like [Harmonia axyridis]|uniref:carboxypeptidase N subunit 2-like n=1 Tax=Harmonia axyridis TaxID=115357 RepID=UPI001E27718F|nr:carboxypeptidase N subunit 2-like [Harmonia axyridis]
MSPAVTAALAVLSLCPLFAHCLVDNVNVIWYEKDSREPQYYYRSNQDVPDGLKATTKIIVNQRIARLQQYSYEGFDNLTELRIDFCKVKEIEPGAFDLLKPLETLTLCGNNIAEIDKGVFNNVQVQHLNLSKNYITYIHPQAFDNITSLQNIVLDYNQLKCWSSAWFRNTPLLLNLSFRHNLFEELPDNAFTNFRTEIKTNSSQLSLDFGYNRIHLIHPRAFKCVDKLDVLNLEYNKLLMLKVETFRNVTRIGHLILKGNPLTCFPKELLLVILAKVQYPAI